ncbi:hypothetical protein BO78DRAFT_385590 [Aspergillus sclerotiicarbonarius CBS 121057]|uniref:Mediator of RNA polymerase II transcription subunit 31 n=1 Tax=Aspergillus sclerotiicarbonarius (strain CBS 121057 / IBT 28362) TaxID=1448318 RepID=A0A319EEF3_ASPSB|nr:hypothetical protein BO78DRAFT_385590 [Aspergillus sclerotiicarbonarius CBS 121057]
MNSIELANNAEWGDTSGYRSHDNNGATDWAGGASQAGWSWQPLAGRAVCLDFSDSRQHNLSNHSLLLQLSHAPLVIQSFQQPLLHVMEQQPPSDQPQQPPPPTLTNPRFTLELEFVSSLANPYYLSHLAVTYPNLLGINKSGDDSDVNNESADPDAQTFAAYLAYLYSYWKTPEYAQFLTHPGATLRALRLLQEETFRRDIIRPDVIEMLAGTGIIGDQGDASAETGEQEGEQAKTS